MDVLVGLVFIALIAFLVLSSLPFRFFIALVVLVIGLFLLARVDGEPNYRLVLHLLQYIGYPRRFRKELQTILHQEETLEDLEDPEEPELEEAEEEPLIDQENMEEELQKLISEGVQDLEEKETKAAKGKKKAKKAQKAAAAAADGKATAMQDLIAFTDIEDDLIHYNGKYYGAVLEIPPVEFRLFSESRKKTCITRGLGKVLRSLPQEFAANIVKLERPVHYYSYRAREEQKLVDLRSAYEDGFLSEAELQARVEIIYNRIEELDRLDQEEKIIIPFYYLVLFESDMRRLETMVSSAISDLEGAELSPVRLDNKALALFLKYSNSPDVDESELDALDPENYAEWAMPESLNMTTSRLELNGLVTHVMRVTGYPVLAGDAWLASAMTMPGTKVVMKCRPMDLAKSVRNIDRSLAELRTQYMATNVDSKRLELEQHIASLSELLSTLQGDNEALIETNIYVTAYDYMATENSPRLETPEHSDLPRVTNMKKAVRRAYSENGLRLSSLSFEQLKAFIATQISAYDPFGKEGRGIPANSVSAACPWVFANICDPGGVKLGSAEDVPVFMDFFKRDSSHVNSNMVIVGKSGSGKSYATKSILANLAADNAKIFILDPENEYSQLAENLHGKFINVGNAQFGRLNPFQIMTALDDDETDSSTVSGSYATHLQFLEEFFRQVLPECDKDALEYLNSIIDRMYMEQGISAETDLSKLRPSDYPVFDDLYDAILQEFQQTDNEYIRTMLRTLMNYVAKFSEGGRNANIWNGPSTVTTEENFTVFNFQSLLSNRNQSVANAQMLLVLKYIDNEIIKNRDYNMRHHRNRRVVVVIDEAHVFIDNKYPIALDFMFQLAKRIRKYNGMQIVITQNIKDFVGSEEIARKSTAIINACQYSFIFALAPNDMDDLCQLYEKAGGINEAEQERIVSAGRGQAFTILGPTERSTFKVEAPESVVSMFEEDHYVSQYFVGERGQGYWEDFVADSRSLHDENTLERMADLAEDEPEEIVRSYIHFEEVEAGEGDESGSSGGVSFEEIEEIPEEAPKAMAAEKEPEKEPEPEKNIRTPLAQNSEIEGLLVKLLSEMSQQNMELRIRQAVSDEVNRRVSEALAAMDLQQSATPSAQAAIPVPAAIPAPVLENTAEDQGLDEDEDFFRIADDSDDFSFDTGTEDEDEEFSFDANDYDFENADDDLLSTLEESSEEEDDSFDILSLLAAAADEAEDTSIIGQMELYEDTVIDITIDDLKQYVQSRSRSM